MNVLLWSPGCRHDDGGNIGLPHLVALGSYVAEREGASVVILDRDYEARLGRVDTDVALAADWDVIGLSCYSSFDYQVVMEFARKMRSRFPFARIVVGGYHGSTCPEDFTEPGSPIDHVVVGEGEVPLTKIIRNVAAGEPIRETILGPDNLQDLDDLPLLRWDLMERYRPLMTSGNCQLDINLSRGCPYACEFCMERGKRSTRYRTYSPNRAILEMRRLLEAFPQRGGIVRITDPLFGLKPAWRAEVLDRLRRSPLPVNVISAVTRSDVTSVADIREFRAANVSVGFGIESGDADMLTLMQKTQKPQEFLSHFVDLVRESETVGMPWGANFIAGHPGETPESLSRSASWCKRFIDELPTVTGFFSIDPYRYYPGSAVYDRIRFYEAQFGTRVHEPKWWQGPSPTQDSTRVDASSTLTYEQRDKMIDELFGPILNEQLRRMSYVGPEREYYEGTLRQEAGLSRRPQS